MNKPLDEVMENSRKAVDYWTEMTKKMMGAFTPQAVNGSSAKAPLQMEEVWKEYYNKQQNLFEEVFKMNDPKDAFAKAPDYYNKWMEIQKSFFDHMVDAYKESADKMGVPVNMDWKNFQAPANMEDGLKQWNKWMEETNSWIRNNILDKMPANMQPHFKNFSAMYSDMYRYWEPLQKMMEYGLYDKNVVEKYFSMDAYKSLIDKAMGFQPVGNLHEMLDKSNKAFEQYIDALQKMAPNAGVWNGNWEKAVAPFLNQDVSPLFRMMAEMNEKVRSELVPFYNVAGKTKEAEIAKLLRDIQFAYAAYLIKMTEMQTKVYQAGQFALPDTIRTFYHEYEKVKQLPDYELFFKKYVNTLEHYLTEALESDAYSLLQNEVAKAGLTVKSKFEQIIELMFADFPFLKKSEGDDIAREAAALRKKLRTLESKVVDLEEKLHTKAAPAAPAEKKTKKEGPVG